MDLDVWGSPEGMADVRPSAQKSLWWYKKTSSAVKRFLHFKQLCISVGQSVLIDSNSPNIINNHNQNPYRRLKAKAINGSKTGHRKQETGKVSRYVCMIVRG
ncbi:MAG: hypothetical protein L6Q59_04215 [Ignavibacteriaceae bacterium]|nr:hypothetical protein [Ignavibacteriaceae bacterium]